jgi:hypothetical protein
MDLLRLNRKEVMGINGIAIKAQLGSSASSI